jgi:DnaD/phage-associated family protein
MVYRFGKTYPDSLLVLPGEILEHIENASENEIRILLALAPHLSGGAEEEEILLALSDRFAREEALLALAFWRGCGILKTDSRKKSAAKPRSKEPSEKRELPAENEPAKKVIDVDEAPFYSSADLAEAAEKMPEFKNLVSFAEGRLEKVLNTSELAKLYSFLDYLKLPADVVMLVMEDCCSQGKKSLRYLSKVLLSLADEEINTYEKAEAYFLAKKERAGYERYVRNLFGIGDRKLSHAEAECIAAWKEKFSFGEEMLDAAYEKTVAAAKNPTIKYMHKILESWHSAGIATPDAIDSAPQGEKAPKSYDLDDFFEKAVASGRKDF